MKLAEEVIEMVHEARQLDLFERSNIGMKAYSSVHKIVIRTRRRMREVRDVIDWEIEINVH